MTRIGAVRVLLAEIAFAEPPGNGGHSEKLTFKALKPSLRNGQLMAWLKPRPFKAKFNLTHYRAVC